MGDEVCCLICNETQGAIRASQRTSEPIFCFDGMDEAPHHVFVDRRQESRDASTLMAVRAAYAEYRSTGDVHELARAAGNILEAGGD